MAGEYLDYALILLVMAIASYIQAIAGFAFGVLVMGGISAFHLMSVAEGAIVVSLLAMVNTATALSKGFANIRWREAGISLLFSMPFLIIGLYLLDLLSGSHIEILRIGLSIAILVSGLMLLKPPPHDAEVSGLPSFAGFGVLAGLMGGLFSISGPPMVYQFYRQPMSIRVIRDSLLALYFSGAAARTVLVAFDTGIETRLLFLSAGALPVVILFTKLGQNFAPDLSIVAMRRIVFGLIALTALILLAG